MAWKSQTQAAELLGVSERTLSRRISAGMLETRRDGRRVLVNVDNAEEAERPMAEVAEIGRQLAEVATSAAIEKAQYGGLLADIRRTLDNQVRQAREEAGRAWRVGYVAGAMAIVLTAVSCWLGWMIYSEALAHSRQVADLTSNVSVERGKAESLAGSVGSLRNDLEQSDAAVLQTTERLASVEAERRRLQAELKSARAQRYESTAQLEASNAKRRALETEMTVQIAALVGSNEQSVSEIERLCIDLEQSEATNAVVDAQLSEMRIEKARLQSALQSAQMEQDGVVADARQHLAKHEGKMLELSEELAAVRKRAGVLADGLQKTWDDLEEARGRHDEFKKHLAEERKISTRLRADLATAEAQRMSAVDQSRILKEQVDQLGQKLAARPSVLEQLRAVFAGPPQEQKRTAAR